MAIKREERGAFTTNATTSTSGLFLAKYWYFQFHIACHNFIHVLGGCTYLRNIGEITTKKNFFFLTFFYLENEEIHKDEVYTKQD